MGVQKKLRADIIQKIVQCAKKKVSAKQFEMVKTFIEQYFFNISVEDLQDRLDETAEGNAENLFAAVFSHWKFLSPRKPGQIKINVFNPNPKKDGWETGHTIVQIAADDMPFMVDSLLMELERLDLTMHFIVSAGGIKFHRDSKHHVDEVLPYTHKANSHLREAPIYIEIDKQTDPAALKNIKENLTLVLEEASYAVEDWGKMRMRVEKALIELTECDFSRTTIKADDLSESIDFLQWIASNHFTFLGYREYRLHGGKPEPIDGSELGVLRFNRALEEKGLKDAGNLNTGKMGDPTQLLEIRKTARPAKIHRRVRTDRIALKIFDSKTGKIVGEHCFIGLYTSVAYNSRPQNIPFLRHKVAKVIERSHLPPEGHAGKALLNILETLPRDELFQASLDKLFEVSMGVLQIQERRRIRLFVIEDISGRFVSCLVYVPRDRFTTKLRKSIQAILEKAFNGIETSVTPRFTDSVLARIYFVIRVDRAKTLNYDVKSLEQELIAVARSWEDDMQESLLKLYGEEKGIELFRSYSEAFPSAYRETFYPISGAYDVQYIEALTEDDPVAMNVYSTGDYNGQALHFKLFHSDQTIPISDVLPILENMGLRVIRENPYQVRLKDGHSVWINDFFTCYKQDITINIEAVEDQCKEAFIKVWFGQAENDGFNRLVLKAAMTWKEITIFRAYSKYLKQIGFALSQDYIEEALSNNPEIALKLVELFNLRFDPNVKGGNIVEITKVETEINQMLEHVASLDEDRIMRAFLELIHATIRTNYFQPCPDGSDKDYLSFKIQSESISEMPEPRPMYEIFVYSPRVEGVHLRSSSVARGGLRWSDRREDFRTEVLGLMKAQKVKNAVIVPSGAKGGFFPKLLPADGTREEVAEEVMRSYKTFIRGLLDITDNKKGNKVVRPRDVVCHDDEDPYFVVAADKGTATFSDIANEIAIEEYDFWLRDAFASGGGAGYDHKKMGITARGAWESVKRLFREVGTNIDTTDFTVVAIGDMSGDVFGNGMLLSNHIKLVAAFNHMHIFLDPDPDAAKSFNERKRLFNMPRSTWAEYNPELISRGGGVFSRSVKSIKLSSEVKSLLGLSQDHIVPNDLIKAILKAQVELLWNGGIGTYIKSSKETHADAADRSNDAIRINADEARARVIGEGGNLGITQLARVQYALNGGMVYCDFIDNSAGVDCSDHEVNIKILLNDVVDIGDLTLVQRNKLLAEMTDEVAQMVLRHNYQQTQALSIAATERASQIDLYRHHIRELETRGLNRAIEFIPSDKGLMDRKAQGFGLTRPELAVLYAYGKVITKEEILASDLLKDPFFNQSLLRAFPKPLVKKYERQLLNHSLNREIIATRLSNGLYNRMGCTFIHRLSEETGASIAEIVKAYTIAQHVFDLPETWDEIETLDNVIPAAVQMKMMCQMARLVRRATRWFLRNRRGSLDITQTIDAFHGCVQKLGPKLPKLVVSSTKDAVSEATNNLKEENVPEKLAVKIGLIPAKFSVLDIVEAHLKTGIAFEEVATVYYRLSEELELSWFRELINAHPVESHWDALARASLRDDLDAQQRVLSIAMLTDTGKSQSLSEKIEAWLVKHQLLIQRWTYMLNELKNTATFEFAMFSVAMRELLDIASSSAVLIPVAEKSTRKIPKKKKPGRK